MKRFVVLCSVVALLISLYVPTWATAPSVADLPDTRMESGDGSGTGLQKVLDNAYNIEQFIKDFDDGIGDLTIDVTDHTSIDVPPSQAPVTPVSSFSEVDVDNNVDVFGQASAGWFRYTAEVDDASNPVSQRTAVSKYSTFALNTPSLSEGRFFDLSADGWQLAYAWMGEDIVVSDLDSTITPVTSVDWEVYVNSINYLFDSNGNLLGIDPQLIDHGSSVVANGWNVSISSTGGIVVAPGGSYSPGPLLIGILAINQSDSEDIDATRILVSEGMLASATPGGYSAATHGGSETFEDLNPATPIPTPVLDGDARVVIQDGSHWTWNTVVNDNTFTVGGLEITDLDTDPDLPTAALPANLKGVISAPAVSTIATGNALKATFALGSGDPPAIRMTSRAFTDVQAGEVYTFAMNVATDIQDATDAPGMLMALLSGLGSNISGFNLDHLQFGPGDPEYTATQGSLLDEYHKDIFPDATEGWQTLSVNWTPPMTMSWFDLNADNNFDQDDLDLIATIFGSPSSAAYEGWTNELTTMKAAFRISAHADQENDFHVWMDNLRIYKSAYELDLGLEKTEYAASAGDISALLPPALVQTTTGDIDGSIESYSSDLDGIGFKLADGSGLIDAYLRDPYGSFPAGSQFGNASAASIDVADGPDHTKSDQSSKSISIRLTGTESGDFINMRAWIETTFVALPGSGIYCMETYMTKNQASNAVSTNRTPTYLIALNQGGPNPLVTSYGTVMTFGGTPNSIGDDGWARVVATGYIPEAQLARAIVQAQEDNVLAATNFGTVEAYFDDFKIYRVDDPAKFFDADLFDS
jgi:hypothetical protein